MAKFYNSELCKDIADDALQVHGGSGYTEEYDVARILRDARITTLYEGTSQLQVVAAIGGINAGMAPTGFLRQYIEEQRQRFAFSPTLASLYEDFDMLSKAYRAIKDEDRRAELAWEAVLMTARLVNGVLMERAAVNSRLAGQEKDERLQLNKEYHLDSKAIFASVAVQIRA